MNGEKSIVASAMGRIDFLVAATSEALEDIAHRLEAEYPHHGTPCVGLIGAEPSGAGYRLASADNRWNVWLTPTSIALATLQAAEDFVTRLQSLAASLEAVLLPQIYSRVELHYFQAGPTLGPPRSELLSSVGIPWERAEELTQTLKGSLPKGHFTLRFGVHPADEEAVYVADASVFTDSVPQRDLAAILQDLGHEGLHLLYGLARWEGRPASPVELPWELLSRHASSWLESTLEPLGRDLFEPINEERLRLLSRKYSGLPFSPEDEIRLQDLGERVQRLLPRVIDRDFAELEAISSRTDDLAETVRQTRERLHLGEPQ